MNSLDIFASFLSARVNDIKLLVGDDWAVTIILRHKTDKSAHAMLGEDQLDGVKSVIADMEADPGLSRQKANEDGVVRPN
jgi:hypothetical protein